MLTVKEIAEKLRVSQTAVRMWIDAGKLKAYQFQREYRVDEKDFEEFMEKSKLNND